MNLDAALIGSQVSTRGLATINGNLCQRYGHRLRPMADGSGQWHFCTRCLVRMVNRAHL